MEQYKPNYQETNSIGISDIIFENNPEIDSVTIYGFLYNDQEKKYVPSGFSCDFSILTTLLNLDYDTSEKLINHIADIICSDKTNEPIIIDIQKLYGNYILLKDIELIYYRPFIQNENGEWHEVPKNEEFFIIDKVDYSWDIRNAPLIEFQQKLDKQFQLLKLAYSYYLLLLKNGFKEKQARKSSGLDNELLFRIADLNYNFQAHELR